MGRSRRITRPRRRAEYPQRGPSAPSFVWDQGDRELVALLTACNRPHESGEAARRRRTVASGKFGLIYERAFAAGRAGETHGRTLPVRSGQRAEDHIEGPTPAPPPGPDTPYQESRPLTKHDQDSGRATPGGRVVWASPSAA